ncbi:MAG: Hsp70 family protein [Gammaproteobacteria bacterium]|nr:Hsp70 family protein [Pseudomonadales bacterium]MCP5345641.1 Hsp70 family protein [Pseudomonadales bacterium]
MTNPPSPQPSTDIGIGIGIDYGTSNSAAAVFDGNTVTLVPLEGDITIMPSATYVDRRFQITTGQAAIDAYIASNSGRKVELSAEYLGEGRTSTGQVGETGLPEEAGTEKFFGQSFVDAGEKGRLFRGVKRLLGDASVARLMVFDRPFRLVALVTPLLLRIGQALSTTLKSMSRDSGARHACIGHPVNFEGRAESHNQVALERLSEACGYAGFERQRFFPEPIAAAISYLFDFPQLSSRTMLAVDFGGGTLDLCLLRHQGEEFEVVATHGVGLGGDHIDQELFRAVLFPLLGKGERFRRKGEDREIETLFPFEEYEDLLLNWAVSYRLNQNRFTTPVMQRIEQGDAAAVKFRRLYELIKNNYSYLAFQAIKDLKAMLSEQQEAHLDIPEIDVDVVLKRSEFELIIADLLKAFEAAVQDTLELAGIGADQVELVIRTGGSSLIPAVKTILDRMFPGKVIEHDPFTSVAAGLAIAEFRGLGASLSVAGSRKL